MLDFRGSQIQDSGQGSVGSIRHRSFPETNRECTREKWMVGSDEKKDLLGKAQIFRAFAVSFMGGYSRNLSTLRILTPQEWTRTPAIQVQTLPLEGPRILRAD